MEVVHTITSAGDSESAHFHRVATEITAIGGGTVRMMEREWSEGDILTIEPGEATDFLAITDVVTVVVKTPSAPDDKFTFPADAGNSSGTAPD